MHQSVLAPQLLVLLLSDLAKVQTLGYPGLVSSLISCIQIHLADTHLHATRCDSMSKLDRFHNVNWIFKEEAGIRHSSFAYC